MIIHTAPNVASAELCYQECLKEADCVYFTFATWNHTCTLKSDRMSVSEGISGLVSGPADCGAAMATPACKLENNQA